MKGQDSLDFTVGWLSTQWRQQAWMQELEAKGIEGMLPFPPHPTLELAEIMGRLEDFYRLWNAVVGRGTSSPRAQTGTFGYTQDICLGLPVCWTLCVLLTG